MRFDFDHAKSRAVKKKHGVSLEEAQEIFDQSYLVDQKNDDPRQFRAIGWCQDRLCSVICEVRNDADGDYYHLVTTWKATEKEDEAMPKISKKKISADKIAEKATRGEDVSSYFTNKFTVVRPVKRVNVDLTPGMLRQLDHRASRLNISRQAVIKTLLDQALGASGSSTHPKQR